MAKKLKEMKKIKVYDALALNNLMNSVNSLSSVSADAKRLVISAKRSLNKIGETYQKDLAELMKMMNVETKDGKYTWEDREDQEEIVDGINSLLKAEVEADWLNSLSEEDVDLLTKNMALNDIIYFQDLLLKEDA